MIKQNNRKLFLPDCCCRAYDICRFFDAPALRKLPLSPLAPEPLTPDYAPMMIHSSTDDDYNLSCGFPFLQNQPSDRIALFAHAHDKLRRDCA